MGFSFRNLFPDKEGGDSGSASQQFGAGLPDQRDGNVGNSAMPPQGAQGKESAPQLFGNAQPTDRGSFEQMFAGARPNESAGGGQFSDGASRNGAAGLSGTYLAGELLQFIPPALASQDAVPMELAVHVSLPADGSRDVKLSDLYLGCPQLFATEITPLNDSQVTLPDAGPVGGAAAAGGVPGTVPASGAIAPPNPFGAPAVAEDQRNAQPAAGGAPNPFDPRGASGVALHGGAGAAPQAATPSPMSWQQETEVAPEPEPVQPSRQPAEPQAQFSTPPPVEAAPAGGDFSGQKAFDPQASMAGPQPLSPFTAPTESPFSSAPESSAPTPAFEPAPATPLAGGEPPQESPFGGDGGDDNDTAADGGGGSPFDLDEDNPFFLAEDDDEDEFEEQDNGALGAIDDFVADASASPFESAALPASTPAPGSPADQMGALEPPPSSATAPGEPAMPWPAAEAEPSVEVPSFSDAFSGADHAPPSESSEEEVEPVAEVTDPTPAPTPASSSIFGSPGAAKESPADAGISPTPLAAQALATEFAAAVPADQAPSMLSPSPFETAIRDIEPEAEPEPEPLAEQEIAEPADELEMPSVADAEDENEESTMASESAPPVQDDSDATLSFVLRDLLFPHEPKALGFSADLLPYGLKAELPLKRIEPQLASGRVTVSLGDLAVAVEPPHGEILAQGNQNLEIELPPTALFHQLERVSEAKASAAAEVAQEPAEEVEAETPEVPATPLFSTEPPSQAPDVADSPFGASSVDEPQEDVEVPLPPAGASSGFLTPFSDLAKDDEAQVDPVQETRFAAQPVSEGPPKAQMRFGTYPRPSAEDEQDAVVGATSNDVDDVTSDGGKSSPPPLPALAKSADGGAPASAGISGNIWQGAQIPGPLRKTGKLSPADDLAAEEEPEPKSKAVPAAESKPKVEKPQRPSRSINISLGPGAVTAAELENKLSPMGGKITGVRADEEIENGQQVAAAESSQVSEDDNDQIMEAIHENNASPAGLILEPEAELEETQSGNQFSDVDPSSEREEDENDGVESMIFTSSRPDSEKAQATAAESPSSMAEDSLDTLPSFADLSAQQDDEPSESFDGEESDFFAELEPPPFSFQTEVAPKPLAAEKEEEVDAAARGVADRTNEIPFSGSEGMGMSGDDEFRDLQLRVIFGTTEEFTLRRVAELTLDLCSSIDSCALLTRGRAVDVSRRDGLANEGEAQRRARQAQAMHRNLRDLADNAGLTQAQALTLHTDREAISFFQRGDICLTVRHDRRGFPPGVREKLMLVAHGVAAMEERR